MKSEIIKQIEEFERETGIKLEYKKGNPYYSGDLDLEGTSIQSLPDGLTVGGGLCLEGTNIQSLPDGLTVGGYLYLEGTRINNIDNINKNIPDILEWRNKKYIKCDGVFNVVVSHKGNVYQVKDIGKDKIYYLVGGNGKWAHGNTIQEAKRDLIYKISNRDKSRYKNLNLDSILSYEEEIECYRVITGACAYGTRGFIENKLSVKKDSYTISEIIKLTDGEYGNNEFKKFFTNKKNKGL